MTKNEHKKYKIIFTKFYDKYHDIPHFAVSECQCYGFFFLKTLAIDTGKLLCW